jgi:hypothetical protein
MNFRCLAAAVAAVALCAVSLPAPAADTPGMPRRTIDERPFGGPPPQRRSMDPTKVWGTSCKTPSLSCKLEKAQQVGSACACPGSDGKEAAGVIEQPK